MTAQAPTTRSLLGALTKARLADVARAFEVQVAASATKEAQAAAIARSGRVRFRALVETLQRDELRTACRRHGVSADGRSRPVLVQRLLEEQKAFYTKEPDAADKLLTTGESVRDQSLPRADFAATTMLVSAVMNFDEFVMER